MKTLITVLALTLATATSAFANSGVITTEQWVSIDNPYNVSPENTPEALGEAGKTLGEFLKDANEDIGKAAKNTKEFFEKI